MGEFSLWHWIIVAIVFMALFGYRKLPDAARSIGRSMRVFKAEMKGMREDDDRSAPQSAQPGLVVDGQVLPPGHRRPDPTRTATGEATAATPPAAAGRPTGVDPDAPRGD